MAEETKSADAEDLGKLVIVPTEDELLEELPDMGAAHQRFICSCPAEVGADKAAAQAALMAAIKKDKMAKYYSSCCAEMGWTVDEALLSELTCVPPPRPAARCTPHAARRTLRPTPRARIP